MDCAGKLSHCQGPAAAGPCPFLRLSFANASEEQIVNGIQRLGQILQTHTAPEVDTQLSDSPSWSNS